jgi:hypothetical protein
MHWANINSAVTIRLAACSGDHHPDKGGPVPIEQLTYAQIAERLGITADAARAIVQRHRLPRARANDSNKILVTIDLADIQHKPRGRSSLDQEATAPDPVAPLLARIAELEAELEKCSDAHRARVAELEAELERRSAARLVHVLELEAELTRAEQCSRDHRADYERERDRADCLLVDHDRLVKQIEGLRGLELGTNALLQASQTEQVQHELVAELETVRSLLQLQAAQASQTEQAQEELVAEMQTVRWLLQDAQWPPDVRPIITQTKWSADGLARGFQTALQAVNRLQLSLQLFLRWRKPA